MFYAPVLFQTMGFGSDASLLSAVVTGLINVVSTFIAIFTVDRCGRKILLIEAAIQMLVAQVSSGRPEQLDLVFRISSHHLPDLFGLQNRNIICQFPLFEFIASFSMALTSLSLCLA